MGQNPALALLSWRGPAGAEAISALAGEKACLSRLLAGGWLRASRRSGALRLYEALAMT